METKDEGQNREGLKMSGYQSYRIVDEPRHDPDSRDSAASEDGGRGFKHPTILAPIRLTTIGS